MGEQEPRSTRPGSWWRRLDTWQQLAGILGTLTGVVALLLALGVIEPFDDPAPPPNSGSPASDSGEIDRFDGVAGHLAESRALLDFLDQHDDETVYLEVGFPELAAPPTGSSNVFAEEMSTDNGTQLVPRTIQLMTECDPGAPLPEDNPTVSDGCMGTALTIHGPVNEDSTAYFMHGVPNIKGHFLVDVTGALHMGITPILLRPLTFEQATGA